MIALTITIAAIATVLTFAAGNYGLAACGAAAGHAAVMLYQDRFEPRRVSIGLKIAASAGGRSAVVEELWHAIGRKTQELMVLRAATLLLMAALIIWLGIR